MHVFVYFTKTHEGVVLAYFTSEKKIFTWIEISLYVSLERNSLLVKGLHITYSRSPIRLWPVVARHMYLNDIKDLMFLLFLSSVRAQWTVKISEKSRTWFDSKPQLPVRWICDCTFGRLSSREMIGNKIQTFQVLHSCLHTVKPP